MDKTGSTTIVIAVIVLSLALMVLGWRSRQKRQSSFARPDRVPSDVGADLLSVEGFYVATTLADQELNRVAVSGLGFRSRATLTLTARGLILALDGVAEMFIRLERIRSIDRATFAIDRVVEKGGLVRLGWTLGDGDTAVDLDSYLRAQEPPEASVLIDLVISLLPAESAVDVAPTDSAPSATPTEGHTP